MQRQAIAKAGAMIAIVGNERPSCSKPKPISMAASVIRSTNRPTPVLPPGKW